MNKYSSFLFTTCRWERLTLILPLIVSLKTTRSFKTVEQGWNLWHCQPVKEWLEWTKLMREKQVNSVSYVVIFDDDDDDLLLVLLCAFWENSYKNGFLMLVCVCVVFFQMNTDQLSTLSHVQRTDFMWQVWIFECCRA